MPQGCGVGYGAVMTMTIQCMTCKGSGKLTVDSLHFKRCVVCQGTGQVVFDSATGENMPARWGVWLGCGVILLAVPVVFWASIRLMAWLISVTGGLP